MAALGWRMRNHPEALSRIERLNQGLEMLDLGATGLVRFVKDVASSPVAAQAEAAQVRASEAQAAMQAAE